MRLHFKTEENPSPQYDNKVRMQMKNSLAHPDKAEQWIKDGMPYVVRIKMPENEEIQFILLWKYLGWEKDMPQWAHLPLILKPDGHGKLSKRDGDKLGFPVFAMNWTDPKTGELTEGFRERGFLPEAFINMLAMLGWNAGTEQELFSLEELVEQFSIERVHKGGAKFDFEKAKWFNHEWIKKSSGERLLPDVKKYFDAAGVPTNNTVLAKVIDMVKERCVLLPDFVEQAAFFFVRPAQFDLDPVKAKWSADKTSFFNEYCNQLNTLTSWDSTSMEVAFKELAAAKNIKPGELMLPYRIMLVGGKFGPPVFAIAEVLGKDETEARIRQVIKLLGE
jgi:glutamyl-tRNA synthetase